MGYYTDFIIEADNLTPEDFKDALEDIAMYEFGGFENGLHLNGKWYSHKEDMKALSKLWSGTVFTVSGSGEESDDIWKAYYKDGKMQMCEAIITFEDFNEEKLK